LLAPAIGAAAPLLRAQTPVGTIVDARGSAEIDFVDAEGWRVAEIQQALLTGDDLRTGALGALALLFADRTQIRVTRNTKLRVTSVAGAALSGTPTLLELLGGELWSRAEPGGSHVEVRTPAATAAIRGTDWSLEVDPSGRTTLIVLDGQVVLENPQGTLTVGAGQAAVAEIGKAPSRLFIARPALRPQLLLYGDIRNAFGELGAWPGPDRARRARRAEIDAVPEANRTAANWIELAEIAVGNNEWELAQVARTAAAAAGAAAGRVAYVDGFVAAQGLDYGAAAARFQQAAESLDGPHRRRALAAAYLALLLDRRLEAAEAVHRELEEESPSPELALVDSAVEVFAGDANLALHKARVGVERFPDQPQLRLLLGQLLLLLDRGDELRDLADESVARLPDASQSWHLKGRWLADIEGDYRAAIVTYQEALKLDPRNTDILNELGLSLYAIDENREAEKVFRSALAIDERELTARTNLSFLLLDQNRFDEAEPLIRQVRAEDPAFASGLLLEGRLAFHRGDIGKAAQRFLEASTANPIMSDALLANAIAFEAQEDFPAATASINDAIRADPNDPTPPLVGAVFARNKFEADRSIELAREADHRIAQTGALGTEQVAAARGGAVNLGAAFSFLNLDDWGNYYAERVFDPLDSGSLFYRAAIADDPTVTFSSNTQGYILDPLGVADRLRYTDVLRRPFLDVGVGGRIGESDGAGQYGASFDIEALRLGRVPIALSLIGNADHDNGNGPNRDGSNGSLQLLAGAQLTPFDGLFAAAAISSADAGVPGSDNTPDPDDEVSAQQFSTSIGYSHKFSARNALLARAFYTDVDSKVSNGRPFGEDLDPRVSSLLQAFGREGYSELQDAGLFDATNTPCGPLFAPFNPLIVAGTSLCGGQALPLIDALGIDGKTLKALKAQDQRGGLQLRHAFDLGAFRTSYGAELTRRATESKVSGTAFRDASTGLVVSGDFSGQEDFPYLETIMVREQGETDWWTLDSHFDVLWSPDRRLQVEAGLFPDLQWESGDARDPHVGPRAGIAWSPVQNHWLRLVYRDQRIGPSEVTLSPAATLGLVGRGQSLAEDGRSRSAIARWDAEWTRYLYTGLELRHELFHNLDVAFPRSLESVDIDNGRLDSISLSVNAWLTRGIGVFGRAELRESDRGGDDAGDLPLVSGRVLTSGATWIHPSSLQLTLSTTYEDDRPSIESGRDHLDSFVSTDFQVAFEPFNRHLALQLNVLNLFDVNNEIGDDVSGAGRTVLLGATVRF
jgi:Tfp pilus assembly protein PilF